MRKYFYTCCPLDCARRRYDASKTYYYLEANGWKATKDISNADLILIYTCGGFNSTESRSVRTIQKALSYKKENSKVVVSGCLLKINPNAFAHLAELEVIPDSELHKLDALINATWPYDEFPEVNWIPEVRNLENLSSGLKWADRFNVSVHFFKIFVLALKKKLLDKRHTISPYYKERFNIKISSGCLGHCTYCAIKIAHGKLCSKSPERIIEEFRKGLDDGFKRFIFISHDMGCYGLDIGTNIFSLLKSIFAQNQDFQWTFHDFNVQWLIKNQELLDLLITHKDRIEEINIPIQSGSDRILRLMKRPYTKEGAYNVLTQIQEKMPGVKLLTQIMVGFPGETTEDFMETSRLIDAFDFHHIQVFCYQDRPGVEAAFFPNKVGKREKVKRAQELEAKGSFITIKY